MPGRKITHYLLSTTHRDGQHKAAFFRGFGFTSEDWQALASALLQHARTYDVIEITPTPFGQNYVVEGTLPAPDGRAPNGAHLFIVACCSKLALSPALSPEGARSGPSS